MRLIKEGSYKEGDKLPSVRELCESLEVGRSAVRDALTTLKGRGLVEIRHGEGTFVTGFNPKRYFQHMLMPHQKELESLFQVREILETSIVKLAAVNRTEQDLVAMRTALDEMSACHYDENGFHDCQFHLAIAHASGNNILHHLLESISQTMGKSMADFHRLIASKPDLIHDIHHQHELIMEMIVCEDASGAHEAMLLHLSYVKKHMRKGFSIRSEFIETH
ncbi:FadR/GntR family transcriptional regulator [Pseudalkalibacillus hwajinpoensis]|uniref:FadR/GntR family transcriptional regulator n=1 Tax=Guptibacillus hwajinpoensis TaxID=208199 RepID=UPI00325C0564